MRSKAGAELSGQSAVGEGPRLLRPAAHFRLRLYFFNDLTALLRHFVAGLGQRPPRPRGTLSRCTAWDNLASASAPHDDFASRPMIGNSSDRFSLTATTDRRNPRVHFERFQWLAAPFPSRFLLLMPSPGRASVMRRAWWALSAFLKNNTKSQSVGQEIVDFLIERASPRSNAFANPRERQFSIFMMTGCSANPRAQRGMTRTGKLAEARRSLHSVRMRLVARPVRGAFAGPSERPVRATPQSTSASPAQAEGAMGSASATAPAMTPIRGTM
jgi:hypothetical protein